MLALPFPGYKICCVECLQSQGREHSIECDVRYIQQNFYTPDMHLIRVSQRPFPTYRLCHLGSNFVIQWKFFQVWWLQQHMKGMPDAAESVVKDCAPSDGPPDLSISN